jgi:small subunit ribosomal protein S1
MSAAEALARVTQEAAADTPAETSEAEAAAPEPAIEAQASSAAAGADGDDSEPRPEAGTEDPAAEAGETSQEVSPAGASETRPEVSPAGASETRPEESPAGASETHPEESPVEAEPESGEVQPEEGPVEAGEAQPEESPVEAEPESGEAPKKSKKAKKTKPAKPDEGPPPDRPELGVVYEALANRQPLEGRVIGWNNGGFHLALGELAAFCPRSEMEVGEVQEPESYLDRTFDFRVLRLQGKGRRIVVSRAAHLRREMSRQRNQLRKKLRAGAVLDGTVASLKDFGAFVDLGGAQGLVHVSEISHRRVEHPREVLSEGQEIRVKVLKVEQGGRRISLSLRALEANPWKDLADRFPQGAVVKGTVERANEIGAFIELAPGLTGLLPAKLMSIPRETTPARAYPPGKEVSVQIVSVDPRRQRIALALEGSGLEGSRTDYKEYQRQSREAGSRDGFNALASAFRRLQDGD